MVRGRLLLAAGLVAYAVGALATLPAGHLRGWLEGTLPGLRVGRVDGPFYAGRIVPAAFGNARVERVTWRWSPAALLLGRLAADVDAEAAGPSSLALRVASPVWSSRIELSGAVGTVDLGWAGGLAANLPGRLAGRLVAEQLSLTLGADWPLAADGAFTLQAVEVVAPVRLEIGDLAGRLGMEGERLRIDFTASASNPIAGDGTLLLGADGGYRLSAALRPRDAGDSAAAARLRLAGRPGPDGTVRIDHDGRWR